MLLNVFFIYLVAFATEAAAFSSKRIGRTAADKNNLSKVGEVEKRNTLHYSGQNGRENQCIDTDGGLKCPGKSRIRRRGPPSPKRRQKIHTKDETLQCPGGGCELPWGGKRIETSPLKTATMFGFENLLPHATIDEIINAAQDKQQAIKYQALGNEENPALSVEEVKGDAAGNKLLDQSPQADSDDDYGQEQEEMTQNGIKSSVEEAETNGEQILRSADEENLALVEKRHKRKYDQNILDTLAAVAEKQREEGRLDSKKQLLVHENEVKYEEGKRRCCNKKPNYGKNKIYSASSNEAAEATDEEKGYGQDTQALRDEENVSDNSEDAEDQEAIAENKPSAIENGENKLEEGNVHEVQHRSESVRVAQKGKARFEEKAPIAGQKSAYSGKQALKSLSKAGRSAREVTRKEGEKKKIGCREYLQQASTQLHKHLSGNVDDSKSSLKERSEGEEGGERDEEETLEAENVGDLQESNDRASILGNKNDQQHAFDEDNDEVNLEEQAAMNEQNQALQEDEVQEEASENKYESRQVSVDEQRAAQSNLEQYENEENKAIESEVPNKRQVSEGELEKEESRKAVAGDQLDSLNSCGPSECENNGSKIAVKRAENSERQTEENEQALTDNDKESGEEDTETSSFETSDENQGLEDENLEDESDKQHLRNEGYLNTERISRLGEDSEVNIEQENLQPQVETRVQRELSQSENNNKAPLEVPQSLEQEESKEENFGQQESLNDPAEEQYEPLTGRRETNDIASSETGDELTREDREVEQQDLSKIKCCKNKNQPSLANENNPETADVAAETDTQSALENSNQDETLSGASDKAIMASQETEGETSEEEYQELEPSGEDAEEQDLRFEREVRETGKDQN